jgi:hypothetical protein
MIILLLLLMVLIMMGGGFGQKVPIDQTTYDSMVYFTKLMSIGSCVNCEGGIRAGSTKWECDECGNFPNMRLITAWTSSKSDTFECSGLLSVDDSLKHIYIVLRGTNSVCDIMTDVDIKLIKPPATEKTNSAIKTLCLQCQNGKVHQGFYRAYVQSYNLIEPQLRETLGNYPDYKLVIAGHSLGGAVAALYATGFQLEGRNESNMLVVTCGQPLIGDFEFAQWFDSNFVSTGTWNSPRNYYRLTRVKDLIPLIPFWGGYCQLPGEIYIDHDGINPPLNSVFACDGIENTNCSWGGWNNQKISWEKLSTNHAEYFVYIGKVSTMRKQLSEGIAGFAKKLPPWLRRWRRQGGDR